jgi:hypothetical protein
MVSMHVLDNRGVSWSSQLPKAVTVVCPPEQIKICHFYGFQNSLCPLIWLSQVKIDRFSKSLDVIIVLEPFQYPTTQPYACSSPSRLDRSFKV